MGRGLKKVGMGMAIPTFKIIEKGGLFFAFGGDELAVHAADVVELDVLGAFSGAGTGVGAVAEAEFVHLCYHCAYTTVFLYFTLWEQCELADLGADEEHCRAILAGSDTCAAADAAC